MIALPHNIREIGYNGLRLTADEYLALEETANRYELIHGVVTMTPSPLPRHSEVALRIIQQLLAFADRSGEARIFAETDVRFAPDTVYRPDIVAYRAGRLPARVERLDISPDLVVEVLSGGTLPLDLITKRDDYDRFGVGEYWAVDPNTGDLRCWRRQGSRLCELPIETDTVECAAIPGLTLDLSPIRALADGM